MSSPVIPFTTAALRPEVFAGARPQAWPRAILLIMVTVLVLGGFAFRAQGLASEGLSEDELNKLTAVNEYRTQGLTSANGEHPLLMKALLTVSVIAAEQWNRLGIVSSRPELEVPVETALRLPSALFGAATAVFIFLVATELFGVEVGLLAAGLWSFDPLAIGMSRIAKEDTFLVFFFMLAIFFWLRGQRAAESKSGAKPERYYWATAIAIGAMLASKLIPLLIAIPVAYYYIFQRIPATHWVIGKKKFLTFFVIVGLTFMVLSPTIFLPGTWKAMLNFTSYRTMGHDSYEFMGRLYPHKFTDWLNGEPWYFYYVLLAAKLPVLTLAGLVGGLCLLFRRRTGDGRYLLLMWFALWCVSLIFVGGKFMRYVTSLLPAVMITAALAIQLAGRALGRFSARVLQTETVKVYVRAVLPSIVILAAFWSSTRAAPHYRLYMNAFAGAGRAGTLCPQDEFYDAYMQETMLRIAERARPGAHVANETETVGTYYAARANRPDLVSLPLSDPATISALQSGDFVIDARGRTYFTNRLMLARLRAAAAPAFTVRVGAVPAADVYVMDEKSLAALRAP